MNVINDLLAYYVGWVKRSVTHQSMFESVAVGYAALHPPYGFYINNE